MIEKLEFNIAEEPIKNDLNDLICKLNEVIDCLNVRELAFKYPDLTEPKWAEGNIAWIIVSSYGSGWDIHDWVLSEADIQLLEEEEPFRERAFKTREQAETALAEIKEVLRRYQ
jgi:hypothetical protein